MQGRYVKVDILTNWGDALWVTPTTIHICDADGVKFNNETMPHLGTLPDGGGSAANCSNTVTTDYWQPYISGQGGIRPWWQVDLGTAQELAQIKLQVLPGYASRMIKDFAVSISSDGSAFTEVYRGQAAYNDSEQTFDFVQGALTADILVNGTGSHSGGYEPAFNGFDKNQATYSQNANTCPYWIKYDMGAGVSKVPAAYKIQLSTYGPGYGPSEWRVWGSAEGTDCAVGDEGSSGWTLLDYRVGIEWSSQFQERLFRTLPGATTYRYIRWSMIAPLAPICIAEFKAYGPPPPPPARVGRYWQIVQYTNTRAGSPGYQWHLGQVGFYASEDGTGANLANEGNTTASINRDGGYPISSLFSGMYIFADTDAGKIITVDAGEGNSFTVLSVSYANAVGALWAPEQVQIRWSPDGVEWVSAKIYFDNGTTNRQVITGIEQPAAAAHPANFLIPSGRDRIRTKGISLGQRVMGDNNMSFLAARRNRFQTEGVSLMPGMLPFGLDAVPGLVGWWRADAVTGMADGDLMSTWADVSGNERPFTQVSPSLQPTYKTNIVNGLPAILLDGVVDFMNTPTIATGARSFVLVAKYTGATFASYDGLLTGTQDFIGLIGNPGTANWYPSDANGLYKDGEATNQGVTNAWHVFIATTATPRTMAFRIGMDRGNTERNWNGYITEVAMYSGLIDATAIAAITALLKTKYGIA